MADQKTTSGHGNPQEVESVESAADAVLSHFLFDPDDRKTVSVVVRGEDGEILGESYPQRSSGVYMLARADVPEDTEPYEVDRPEPPDWVEWIYKDPPLDHFAEGVRCTECGESDSILQKTPDVASEFDWQGVSHRPECPHSDRDDKAYWARRRMAAAVKNRPDPGVMALGCIWDEVDRRPEFDYTEGRLRDALGQRGEALREELKRRLGISYPPCPRCGEDALYLDFDLGICCSSCSNMHVEVPTEDAKEIERKRRRVWGFIGHLDRGRSAGGDDGE